MIGMKTLLSMAVTGGIGGLTMATAVALITDVSDASAGMVAALASAEAGPFAWGLLLLGFVVTLRVPALALCDLLIRLMAVAVVVIEARTRAFEEAREYRHVRENLDRAAAARRLAGEHQDDG